jgi:hypothetical protein
VIDYQYKSVEPGTPKEVKVFELTASMAEAGLGCIAWWETPAEEVQDEERMET